MAFNTGLSGLRASQVDLDVTGNNISNASTVGFKGSKVEFGDLYANGLLSGGTNPVGDGVKVQDVAQQFAQGNVSFTDNNLDMAIDGDGFFVIDNGGETQYTRAGQFDIDEEGIVTNSQGGKVQGYQADNDGNLANEIGDLEINSDNIAPRRTTSFESDLNLDSREGVLEERINRYTTNAIDDDDSEVLTIEYSDDRPDVTIPAGLTADEVTAELNDLEGISASNNDGILTINVEEGIDVGSNDITDEPELVVRNAFDPADQRTYNHTTSSTIYDSLGNSHEMSQYFVKKPVDGGGGGSQWAMHVQIDGEDVGEPDGYDVNFNSDGTLNNVDGETNGDVLISNWTPRDSNGEPNGAEGPDPDDTETPIPDPPTSSNFVINVSDATQYGSSFGVTDQRQNGYTTGRLSGLDVSDEGELFARYTNGESKTLGQVALATFNNTEGLSPVGDTAWVETAESGQPIVGRPGTGTLGSIDSSSVEDSNVDLSAELVNLIIAQRNYQANAKTIETSDAITQTIINLR